MNVSAIGAAQNVYSSGATGSGAATDFKSLAQALQSGDLTAARQAFSQLQQDSPMVGRALSASSTGDATAGSSIASALQALGKALQSGDIGAAQQAFSSMQQSAQAAHHGHHHHRPAPTDSTTAAPAAPATGIDTVA